MKRNISVLTFTLLALATAGVVASRVGGASAVSHWVVDTATLPPTVPPTDDSIAVIRGIAHRPDLVMKDGEIDFELGPPAGGFAGLAFRMASTADYEIIYFRPSDDGKRWVELQYQPVFQGETTWQLYNRAGCNAAIPVSEPAALRVRLLLSGTRADVYLQDHTEPLVRIRELKREPVAGEVGVWTASPTNATTPTSFSHVRVRSDASTTLGSVDKETAPPTQLLRWRVSPRQPSPDGIAPPVTLPAALLAGISSWHVVNAEASGLINLTRALGNPAGAQRTNVFGGAGWGLALANATLHADKPRTVQLWFSYSDGLAVYVNRQRLFVGRNDSDSRFPNYLGIVGDEVDAVDLPLHAGDNELMLAITDKAFGWGFRARLSSREGVQVTP